ncbi:MAG: MFS transporter [Bryobacterales bacterium]|nr:MFS transporter [Bryobacterales bacterium]
MVHEKATAPSTEAKVRNLAWLVMALLFLGSVVNYLDRAVLGVLMPSIRRDLGLTNTGYAMAVNAFLVTYTLSYVVGGRVADLLGCRRTFSLTLLVWSAAAMLHAVARGIWGLAGCRALLGIGEGGYYPAAIRGAAEWFPPKQRAKAIGLVLSALSVGSLLTPPVSAWLALAYGWRVAFLATGAFGLLLIPPWIALHGRIRRELGSADPAPAIAAIAREGEEGGGAPLRTALRSRSYVCLLLARACSDSAWYFYLFWMPGYFQEARGLGLAAVGQWLWIPFLAAGVGAIFGAWASSELIEHGWGLDRSRRSVLVVSAAVSATGAATCVVPGFAAALGLVSVALFAHTSWSSNLHTAITEVTPPRHVAVLYGVTGAAGTLGGVMMQSMVGPLVDRFGYDLPFFLTGALYLTAALLVIRGVRIYQA